jgi:hypothetical protein
VIARGVTSGAGKRVLFGDSSPIASKPGRPAVWCETGTGPWQRVPSAAIPAAPGLTTVLRAGGYRAGEGFVLAGIESAPSGARPSPVAFTSTDCTTWHRRPLGPAQGSAVTILDAAAFGAGVVVTWQDAAGLHLGALDPTGLRAVPAPVAGTVAGSHIASAGPLAVAIVDTGSGARTFTARV